MVLLGGSDLRLQVLIGPDRESGLLWGFDHCEIMGFGHRLQAEFVRKWYGIGRDGRIEETELVQKVINLERTISNILGRDLLPSYPVHLLLLLQQLESNTPLDTTAASYARLYGAVVTANLAKTGGDGGELETKINYLTELAFHLFSTKKNELSDQETQLWHSDYCARHLDPIDFQGFRRELVTSQVLQHSNGQLRFRYKAGFYYFVAFYLSDNLAKEPVRNEVKTLCAQLYREDAANIVMFLCHWSKDVLILDELLATANRLFVAQSEIDLPKDAGFVAKMITNLQVPVLQDSDPETNRLRALEDRDKLRKATDGDEQTYVPHFDEEAADEPDALAQLAPFNATIKTIQITGQILRNFGGRLEGPDKLRLAEACYSLGLRLMKFSYSLIEDCEVAMVAAARQMIVDRKPDLDPAKATEIANSLVFGILRFSTIELIKYVSNSIGFEKLSPVFAEVLKAKPTIARRMIDLSIHLDHLAPFPVNQTLQLYKEVQPSLILADVLRQLVFNRFYFFTAPFDIKQQLCSKLASKSSRYCLTQNRIEACSAERVAAFAARGEAVLVRLC